MFFFLLKLNIHVWGPQYQPFR